MPYYPSCSKCEVCAAIRTNLTNYKQWQRSVEHANINILPDHARGYMHGQLRAIEEVVDDLTNLLPHIEVERTLRMNGKGE